MKKKCILFLSQILLGCDIPLSGDCIIIPYNQISDHHLITALGSTLISNADDHQQHLSTMNATAAAVAHGGPNVIVEPMPYTMSVMDTVVDIEREFNNLVDIPDPQLGDEDDHFFDYTNW